MIPRRRVARGAAIAAVFAFAFGNVLSCDPVEPRRQSTAPTSACAESPCESYEPGAKGAIGVCPDGRCVIRGRADAEYNKAFWIVVHVPGASSYGAGTTFVLSSDDLSRTEGTSNCTSGSACIALTLPRLVQVRGAYKVLQATSDDVVFPQVLPDGTSIPVRSVYTPLGRTTSETFPRLPLQPTFTQSRVVKTDNVELLRASCALPAGRYRRTLFPDGSFESYFPPRSDEIIVPSAEDLSADEVTIAGGRSTSPVKLDDIESTPGTRVVRVTREAGLDGWRVWFEDGEERRRISVVKTLSGVDATVRLDTTGEGEPGGGLGSANLIVAPPAGVLAVPHFVNELASGSGRLVPYTELPPPSPVSGLVSAVVDGARLGFPATVQIESNGILVSESPQVDPRYRYATTVETDAVGRFMTVLPPGDYSAAVIPAVGTEFAVSRGRFEVKVGPSQVALEATRLTHVTGKVELTDNRPLASATILALPRPVQDPNVFQPSPRSFRTRTDAAGNYALDLDQGSYVLTVIPEPWTGFPWVAVRREIQPGNVTLPTMRVPLPTRLALGFRSPSVPPVRIAGATVRIFAEPVAGGDPLEIGSGMTDSAGEVEILLARQP